MGIAELGVIAGVVVGLIGTPLTLRELTRPARLRRSLKADVEVLAALPPGTSKETMQRLVDEHVERLDRLTHPNWDRRISLATAGGSVFFYSLGTLGFILNPEPSYETFKDEPFALVVTVGLLPIIWSQVRGFWRIWRGQDEFAVEDTVAITDEVTAKWTRGEPDDVEKRRTEQNEHDGA